MSETFLQMITAKTRQGRASAAPTDPAALRQQANEGRHKSAAHRLRDALSTKDRINIIAEIKRASPSKGVINDKIDPAQQAVGYEKGGAAAISVLTEPEYFRGSLDDLRIVTTMVDIPVLRKDFIVDEVQIYEAAAAGADAVLLIVAALSADELTHLRTVAEDELGMDALIEVHTRSEMEIAREAGAALIGVNNRDLHSLVVSLGVSRDLIAYKPAGVLMVAESGISTRDEIVELHHLGFDGFLVGESLMRAGDPAQRLEAWL